MHVYNSRHEQECLWQQVHMVKNWKQPTCSSAGEYKQIHCGIFATIKYYTADEWTQWHAVTLNPNNIIKRKKLINKDYIQKFNL